MRNEIQAKDKVIELMLKDKFNERAEKVVAKSSATTVDLLTKSNINEFVEKNNATDASESNVGEPNKEINETEFINVIRKKGVANKRNITLIRDSLIKNIEAHKMGTFA